jgi:AmiR/NasT family two-component response regulator
MEAGCIAYLVKPFSAESLMSALELASAFDALRLADQSDAAPAPASLRRFAS